MSIAAAWAEPGRNGFNLWAYVDARDAALACRLALESPLSGYHVFYIAAEDTLMREPTLELVRRFFPNVERIAEGFGGRKSPLGTQHAAKVLGFNAQYTWKTVIQAGPDT